MMNMRELITAYSPTYYEDRRKEHDFYINLGNQCRIAEEQRQAALIKARREAQERQELQRQIQILNEAKRTLEKSRKLSHALTEYNYTKDRELVLL